MTNPIQLALDLTLIEPILGLNAVFYWILFLGNTMNNSTNRDEQLKMATYSKFLKVPYQKPQLTVLNAQTTAGGTAGVQERNIDSMNTMRKDQGTS